MLELHLVDKDITSGSVPITWCVTRKMIELMQRVGLKDPTIVISVIPVKKQITSIKNECYEKCYYESRKEKRFFARLSENMTYIDFRCPGENKIFAFISDEYSKTKERFGTKGSDRLYDVNIISSVSQDNYINEKEKLLYSSVLYKKTRVVVDEITKTNTKKLNWSHKEKLAQWLLSSFFAKPITVDVPKEAFAKEPAEWEKAWVNWLAPNDPLDQCSFRRRRLFAYTIQPCIFLIQILFRVILLISALLFARRNVNLVPLLNPLRVSTEDAFEIFGGGNFFMVNKDGNLRKHSWMALVFTPINFIIYCVILYITPAKYLGVMGLGIIMAISIINFLKKMPNLVEHFDSKPKWDPVNDTPYLICSENKHVKKRTIKLLYRDLKSKVCKPFAG